MSLRRLPFALLVGLLGLILCLAPGASAQPGEAPPSVEELAQGLEQRLAAINRLNQQIDSAPERYHHSLITRRDDLAFRALHELDALVKAIIELPGDDPQRARGIALLQSYLTNSGERVLKRVDALGERISTDLRERESLDGVARIELEASIHATQELRYRYYGALVGIIEGCRALDIPAEALENDFIPMVEVQVEALVGRMEFTGALLHEMRARKSAESNNADLDAAIGALGAQQERDMHYLSIAIDLLDRLGLETQEYRAVLVQQGQGLSLSTLESGAIATLLDAAWEKVKEMLVSRAPNLLFNILIFVLIVAVFYTLGRLARRGVKAACERPGVRMSTLHKNTLVSLTGGLVTLMGLLIALAQMGISLGPMLAGLGVAGFIVGFALQDTLGNFASGAMILIYRPFDVDDFIEVAGAAGFVKKMSLVSTTITTFDNQTLVVPNSKIWGDVIKNVTGQKVRRVDLVFGISYSDDIAQAESILESVLKDHDKVLDAPEWKVKLHELGDSSVNFVVRPWVRTEDYWDVYWDVTREVKVRFDREGVSIPFPQRDVHIYQQDS